ncbi:MAG: hypothetical protein KJZ65_04045 [Phycisphaerales bacterium]|nr:hypothetical protein [Phycisphaerales bacterium]
MSLGNPAYSVARPTRRCAATDVEIKPGECFIATLVERPGEEDLERLDFSLDAWEGGARPVAPLRLFGFWKSCLSDAEPNARQLLDDDELLDLFEQLAETTDEKRVAFRFVLALVLIRKRLLAYEGGVPAVVGSGKPGLLRVRRRRDAAGEVIQVVDPGMDDAAVEAATEQIGRIMNLDASRPPRGGEG